MKGYYIFAPVETGAAGKFSGVEKKIRNFCEILNESIDVELDILPPFEQDASRIKRVLRRWTLWLPVGHAWKYSEKYKDADFLYIRKAEHDASFIKFLKDAKLQNPELKIIYEMPTYPYEKEQKLTVGNFPIFLKDRIFRRMLKKYVDRIVTFYNQPEILGVPTICIMNGYNFNNLKAPQYNLTENEIHLIEVSTTAFWHGYDRVIEGLNHYYKNGGQRKIVFHMVGPEMPEHRSLVRQYGLEDHVIFYGKKSGKELEEIYKKCSLGIDVLGGHRKDYPISSSLKSREYAEKGIPVITSSPVDYLPDNYKYQLLCSYDDEPINMDEVAAFYDDIFGKRSVMQVGKEIQQIAVEHCDFHVTLKPIIKYLGGN